jgi:hypothetical protein
MIRPGVNPGRRSGKSAADHLSYGTVPVFICNFISEKMSDKILGRMKDKDVLVLFHHVMKTYGGEELKLHAIF